MCSLISQYLLVLRTGTSNFVRGSPFFRTELQASKSLSHPRRVTIDALLCGASVATGSFQDGQTAKARLGPPCAVTPVGTWPRVRLFSSRLSCPAGDEDNTKMSGGSK
jgi:hypothetical protein